MEEIAAHHTNHTPAQAAILKAAKQRLDEGKRITARALSDDAGVPLGTATHILNGFRKKEDLPPATYEGRKKPAITPEGSDEWREQVERHRRWAVKRARLLADPSLLTQDEAIAIAEDGQSRGIELYDKAKGAVTTFTRWHIDAALQRAKRKKAASLEKFTSIDKQLPDTDERTLHDKLIGGRPQAAQQHDLEGHVQQLLGMHHKPPRTPRRLTEPEVMTVLLQTCHGLERKQVAKILRITPQQVSQLGNRALGKIREENGRERH
ncbi:MAG: hypothetical protein V1708_04515 [Candidatus Micrarchaeota archaeon]